MGGGAHAMKRIPRIKFPQRHPKSSVSGSSSSQNQSAPATTGEPPRTFFSRSPSNLTAGGKASEQPKRTPVSQDEIDAIMRTTSSEAFIGEITSHFCSRFMREMFASIWVAVSEDVLKP
ncbi:hypothetical protein M9H77_32522 [Catharanthus roseus]|uniref:Uncharacterized protein n=1 Tax=Catharanthus roseus TaxID=4058 RepID=A0ACC0A4L4_CATRO|nr:hypothetical protein M9H77_32522 [Catharanthus roseus]